MGKIDLLVQEGFYTNRTDFVGASICARLHSQSIQENQLIRDKRMSLGILEVGRNELELAKSLGQRLNFHVIGMLIPKKDITKELALKVSRVLKLLEFFLREKNLKKPSGI